MTYSSVLAGCGASVEAGAGGSTRAGAESTSAPAKRLGVGCAYTSFIDTDRFACFLTRAQKCAMTIESAPRSSKKWLSSDTSSLRTTAANRSARTSAGSAGSGSPRCDTVGSFTARTGES